jgi:multidrug efflux system outer membrane protein
MMSLRMAVMSTVLALVAGCSVGPDHVRPEIEADVPQQWARPTLAEALPDTSSGDHWRWWESFNDQTLNTLIEDALAHNNDLAAAAGRVLEADALLGGARSNQWPRIEVGGAASRSKVSSAQTFGFMDPYRNSFSASANLSYEIDLWGRLSRGKEAALATLLASEEDRRAVAQGLIATVVRTWLEIRELQLQVALNERTVENFTDNLNTVRGRYERGLVTALDVHLASQNLAAAQAAGPLFRQNLARARRQLEILAGHYPAGDIKASDLENTQGQLDRNLMPEPLPPVPAGLPSDLLERRPDLMAAEMRLHASVARVGEAKAALYPRISLTGSAGSSSTELADIFTQPTNVWSLAGNLFMPLINRGATKAQIKAAEARAMQGVAAYRGTVLKAFAEVENALDQDHYQSSQESFLEESVLQAQRAVSLAETRYSRGLDNILVALESQRRLYTAESNLLTTQRLRRTARVNLIQALGGPWENLETDIANLNTQGADQ